MYPDWEDEDEGGDDDVDEQVARVVQEEDFEIDEAKIAMEALAELLDNVLLAKYFPLALARYVLRRAAYLRCRAILPKVLANMVTLMPVLRDLMLYLVKVAHPKNHRDIGLALQGLVAQSDFRALPFVQYWVLSAIQRVPAFSHGGGSDAPIHRKRSKYSRSYVSSHCGSI